MPRVFIFIFSQSQKTYAPLAHWHREYEMNLSNSNQLRFLVVNILLLTNLNLKHVSLFSFGWLFLLQLREITEYTKTRHFNRFKRQLNWHRINCKAGWSQALKLSKNIFNHKSLFCCCFYNFECYTYFLSGFPFLL